MARSLAPRSLFVALTVGLSLVALGCPKKTPEVVDAGVVEPVVVDAAPTVLAPLEEDAGFDAGPDVAQAGKKAGPALTNSQRNVKACCNALRTQAKAMGTTPESAQLTALATQCDMLAMQVGPSTGPQAPELEPLRAILKGKPTLPPVCSGF